MRGALRGLFASGFLVALLLLPSVGRADDKDQARALYSAAKELGDKGLWKEAAKVYADSLRLYRAQITLYSLGVAQSRAGLLVEARDNLQAFLSAFADGPPSPKSKEVEPEARKLLTDLAPRIPTLRVVLEPAPVDAPSLTLDGKPLAAASLDRIEVDPGPHELAVSASGRRESTASISVAEGEAKQVTITLAPRDATPRAVPAPVGALTPSPQPEPAPQPVPQAPRYRAVSIALLGAGGAVFAAGVGVGVAGVVQAHNAAASGSADAHAARIKGIAGDTMAGAGIVAAGVGLILLLTGARPSPPRPAGSAGLSISF